MQFLQVRHTKMPEILRFLTKSSSSSRWWYVEPATNLKHIIIGGGVILYLHQCSKQERERIQTLQKVPWSAPVLWPGFPVWPLGSPYMHQHKWTKQEIKIQTLQKVLWSAPLTCPDISETENVLIFLICRFSYLRLRRLLLRLKILMF